MADVKQAIEIKLECADYIREKIISLCIEHCETSQPIILSKIGSYLGIFSTTLRSALNYTLYYYIKNRLKQRIDSPAVLNSDKTQFEKIKNIDFPWVEGRSYESIKAYDLNKEAPRHKMLELINKHDYIASDFLLKSQPFVPGNEWLWYLMASSNTDKHENIIESKSLEVIPLELTIKFGKNNVLVPNEKREIIKHKLPYYDSSMGIIASTKNKWSLFLFNVDQKDPPMKVEPSLIDFIKNAPEKISKLVEDFYTLPEK
jgi:hypothetical protein